LNRREHDLSRERIWGINIITYLGDRLGNLKTGKRELDDAVKDRDRTITSLGNRVAALQKERGRFEENTRQVWQHDRLSGKSVELFLYSVRSCLEGVAFSDLDQGPRSLGQ
jgi:hypothetical protein